MDNRPHTHGPGALPLLLSLLLALGACGDDSAATGDEPDPSVAAGEGDGDGMAAADDGCTGEQLESDLGNPVLMGNGLVDGQLPPGEYAISTTYLRLKPGTDTRALFNQLVAPVIGDANGAEGLMAQSLALSAECDSARTLTVWRDEAAMYDFAYGEAHAKAMGEVGKLSRGNSIAMHWMGPESDANWDTAAEQLGNWTGRVH